MPQNSLTGSEEVAIVIAINSCTTTCPSPMNVLGEVLYNGLYKPQLTATSYGENFIGFDWGRL